LTDKLKPERLWAREEFAVRYLVEIENTAGTRATKEYDVPSYYLSTAVKQDLRNFPDCRVTRVWRIDNGRLIFNDTK
jgi:hypothetical protein